MIKALIVAWWVTACVVGVALVCYGGEWAPVAVETNSGAVKPAVSLTPGTNALVVARGTNAVLFISEWIGETNRLWIVSQGGAYTNLIMESP